ncbi:LPS translocon maturation chaperone LptM [Isoalcanivorax indicus]|uniref:LPS translocon maturation chaperone LptM n=1 Tax=Isoalcanivorax indicus TaxID=2202653 RepID=UPI000DBA3459|nr:lipoprotein [Isoalcanivorax indicus]
MRTLTCTCTLLLLASTLFLAACGQRGDLYFPGESREPAVQPPPAATDTAEDQDDD